MPNHVNVFSNIDPSMVPSLEALCVQAHGRHQAQPQPDGRFTVTCTLPVPDDSGNGAGGAHADRVTTPAVGAVGTAPGPRPVSGGAAVRIEVTSTDLDALQRVANSEVGHFGRHGEDQLRGGLAAVVDTIFNRVAHRDHPNTIVAVVDKPKQFSAINAVGTWSRLDPASALIAEIVAEHVAARAAGNASEIGGATHFLNPHVSSPSALLQWGNFVVANAVKVYGDDSKKDVHFHGFPPGGSEPIANVVAFAGRESRFERDGHSPAGSVSNETLRRRIVEICRAEFTQFRNGQANEADDPQFLRVGDYWRVVGSANHGRTVGSDGERPAWSAAFVSFVLRSAGAAERFPAAPAHFSYFQHFVRHPGSGLYEARLVSDATPRPGDILHFGRGSAEKFDFEKARRAAGDDSFYPSHSDVVVAVDGRKVVTIGGNVGNSVSEKTFALDDAGRLKDRKEGNRTLPWIGMLQLA